MQSHLRTSRAIARDISRFRGIHAGETCLLVGNGANLHLTPPEWFDYPAFGCNTIHKYEGWRPDYYVAVDNRVAKEFGGAVCEKLPSTPKIVPVPRLQKWNGENFYTFPNWPGPLWEKRRGAIWQNNIMEGLTYGNVMHAMIKLAYWMGFTTMLIIGMQHQPNAAKLHFWGHDAGMGEPILAEWLEGYRQLADALKARGVKILNISEDTYVPNEILPRGDWREWKNR